MRDPGPVDVPGGGSAGPMPDLWIGEVVGGRVAAGTVHAVGASRPVW